MFQTGEMGAATVHARERRSSRRYPVGLNLYYQISRNRTTVKEGPGRTRDFSQDGVFFHEVQPAGEFPAGLDVKLLVDWPAQINGRAQLKVAIFGQTVRCGADGIAVRILRYEVRTSPSSRRPGA